MNSNILISFTLLVIFIASPIFGRPEPNPCRNRGSLDRIQKRIDGMRGMAGDQFDKGKKAQSLSDYKELSKEVDDLDKEVQQAQTAKDNADAAVTAAQPNPPQNLLDDQQREDANLKLKTALRDAKMKDRDLVKQRAGLQATNYRINIQLSFH